MRRRHPIPPKHRHWITIIGIAVALVGTFAGVMARDYLGALLTALLGLFLWLAALGYGSSRRLVPWLVIRLVMAAIVALSLYRILFTFAAPT